jgi:hypothetical protein
MKGIISGLELLLDVFACGAAALAIGRLDAKGPSLYGALIR